MPVFAITDEQFKNGGTYSKYHNKIFHFDAAAKFLISYQVRLRGAGSVLCDWAAGSLVVCVCILHRAERIRVRCFLACLLVCLLGC